MNVLRCVFSVNWMKLSCALSLNVAARCWTRLMAWTPHYRNFWHCNGWEHYVTLIMTFKFYDIRFETLPLGKHLPVILSTSSALCCASLKVTDRKKGGCFDSSVKMIRTLIWPLTLLEWQLQVFPLPLQLIRSGSCLMAWRLATGEGKLLKPRLSNKGWKLPSVWGYAWLWRTSNVFFFFFLREDYKRWIKGWVGVG